MRSVRLPPWAAGANPTMNRRACGSPNPGTGRLQYSSPWKRFTLMRAAVLHHLRSRGQRSHSTTSAVIRVSESAGGDAGCLAIGTDRLIGFEVPDGQRLLAHALVELGQI